MDQHGETLDVLLQSKRDAKAAKQFFRKLLKGQQAEAAPRVIITDKCRSYDAAKRDIIPDIEHRQSRYLNNRVEVSHQPTRQQERHMRKFKSMKQAQRFLNRHAFIRAHFQTFRHRLSAVEYRKAMNNAFNEWDIIAQNVPAECEDVQIQHIFNHMLLS